MTARMAAIPQRRAIIDRRALAEVLANADRPQAVKVLKAALAAGRVEIARRLAARPYAGTETAAAYAFLTDQIVRLAHDFAVQRLHPLSNPTKAERLSGAHKRKDRPWEHRDHALFVAFAPVDAPRFALSVIVEHGEGGSKVAAPIARDIMAKALELDRVPLPQDIAGATLPERG